MTAGLFCQALLVAAALIGCGHAAGQEDATAMTLQELQKQNPSRTPSGLQYVDTIEGTGNTPAAGDHVLVHYTGTLEDGTKFDSSRDRGTPFGFTLGRGQVIRGWDEGLATMKLGGRRTLIIPAYLGYGARGAGGVIPPNAVLLFDVELIRISSSGRS